MLGFTSPGLVLPTAPIPGALNSQSFCGWGGPHNLCPQVASGSTSYILPPTGPVLTIACTIYLFDVERGKVDATGAPTGTPIANGVMQAYGRYLKHTIERTWSSFDPANPARPFNPGMSPSRTVRCNISIVIATTNIGTLRNGEIFIGVRMGRGRSFMWQRRFGAFYINPADAATLAAAAATFGPLSSPATEFATMTDLMPAHEFGHALGLADRYAYLCYGYQETRLGGDIVLRPAHGHTIPLYVDSTGAAGDDLEYTDNYGWLFNLMSTMMPGPIAGVPWVAHKPNTDIVWESLDSVRSQSVHVHNTQRYRQLFQTSSTGILISSGQLDCIANRVQENLPGSGHVFFKIIAQGESEDDYIFDGTFIGYIPNAVPGNQFQVVHDDRYDSHQRHLGADSPFTTNSDADDKMRYRCRKQPAAWKSATPPLATTFSFPVAVPPLGFVQASLDLQEFADQFSEGAVIDGVAVPRSLAALLSVEHLDMRVCFRRAAFQFVQRFIDANDNFVYPKSALGAVERKLDFSSLMDIQRKDQVFTPPSDLFAGTLAYHPQLAGMNANFLQGVYVTYNYSVGSSFAWSNRPGKTQFVTPADPPDVGVQGVLVPITDSNRLTTGSGPGVGRVSGRNAAEMAKITREVWDQFRTLPGIDLNSSNWPYRVMDYRARLYENRKILIALVRNSALRKDVVVSGVLQNSGLDPSRYSLDKCLRVQWISGPSHPSINKSGSYAIIAFRN